MSYIGNSPGNASQRVVTRKVATAGQTRFTSDSGYATGYVDVIVNGSDLVAGVDFNETGDGINIDLVEACAADDNVKIVAYIPRGLSDGYTKPEANALLALKADLVAGKIPSSQLPAYVDDVLEYANLAAFPATGSTGIIYVAQDTNNCYRWSGSTYIVLTDLSSYYTKTQADARYPIQDASTGALQLPSGTTAQRPSSPLKGMTRFNTTDNMFEVWNGTFWAQMKPTFVASGGTVTQSGGYTYHAFTSSGTFTVTAGSGNIEVLMVAGGGGGGFDVGGAGGAGGLVYNNALPITVGSHSVTVGGGGAGSSTSNVNGTNGGNSSFSTMTTAIGGGGGGSYPAPTTGSNGGSGGGGGSTTGSGRISGGSGTSGQGNAGGAGVRGFSEGNYGVGGGGGGAGAAGNDGDNAGGKGGNGLYYAQFTAWGNPSGWFAGGGGGASDSGGILGAGGSGGGGSGNGGAGTANTGGGGSGPGTSYGGTGGSGIVIIRYPT